MGGVEDSSVQCADLDVCSGWVAVDIEYGGCGGDNLDGGLAMLVVWCGLCGYTGYVLVCSLPEDHVSCDEVCGWGMGRVVVLAGVTPGLAVYGGVA